MAQLVNGRRFSLLPQVRQKLARATGRAVTSNVMYVNKYAATANGRHETGIKSTREADAIITAFHRQHDANSRGKNTDNKSVALQAIELSFAAYRRLGELYDLDESRGMRFEPEQDLLIRAILASRCTKLSPDEFARHRERLCAQYGISLFDLMMFVSFPRRRGKSVALAAADALLLATQSNFSCLVINLSAKLAEQNWAYIKQLFRYLQADPEHLVKCEYLRGGNSRIFRSHFGTENILNLLANPDRTPTVRPFFEKKITSREFFLQ